MTLDKFTIKAQEAVQKAQEIATARQHQAIETGHLMKGVLTQQCQALLKDSHGEDIGIRIPRYKAMIEEFNHLIEVNTSKGE